MVASSKYIFYFCNVKTYKRYEAAAIKQRFLYPDILVKSKRKEWGKSNRPEVSACMCLTAPTALSLFNV